MRISLLSLLFFSLLCLKAKGIAVPSCSCDEVDPPKKIEGKCEVAGPIVPLLRKAICSEIPLQPGICSCYIECILPCRASGLDGETKACPTGMVSVGKNPCAAHGFSRTINISVAKPNGVTCEDLKNGFPIPADDIVAECRDWTEFDLAIQKNECEPSINYCCPTTVPPSCTLTVTPTSGRVGTMATATLTTSASATSAMIQGQLITLTPSGTGKVGSKTFTLTPVGTLTVTGSAQSGTQITPCANRSVMVMP